MRGDDYSIPSSHPYQEPSMTTYVYFFLVWSLSQRRSGSTFLRLCALGVTQHFPCCRSCFRASFLFVCHYLLLIMNYARRSSIASRRSLVSRNHASPDLSRFSSCST